MERTPTHELNEKEKIDMNNQSAKQNLQEEYVQERKRILRLGKLGITAILGGGLLISSISTVPANHVGIVFNKVSGGIQEESLSPGWKFHLPFAESIYDVSTYTHTLLLKPGVDDDGNGFDDTIRTQTRDGQSLATQADVQYRVQPEDAHEVFEQFHSSERNVRQNIQVKLPPIIQRGVERVTTKYDVVEILGEKRSTVQEEIEKSVSEELAKYGITLQSFTLVDTDAGDAIEQAIADEAVAQQRVQTAKQQQEKQKVENQINLEKAQAEAEQLMIRAKGEADANRLISESVSGDLIGYKEAEARMKHGWVNVQGAGSTIVNTEPQAE